jgi:citrate lyase subunit beta/citryl-CoA lyase
MPHPTPRWATARSFLFVPGDRPERFTRALASEADVVVVDLEDAVAPAAKQDALDNVLVLLGAGTEAVVRVNDVRTERGRADLAGLASLGVPVAVMVAKAEDADALAAAYANLPAGSVLLPLVETARGVLDARAVAQATGVARLVLGHLDLAAELGLDPDDTLRLWPARFALVAASAAAGLPAPVDGVTTEVRDADVVRRETATSLAGGFTAKLCIHPGQVAHVHAALAPAPEEVVAAERLLAAVAGRAVAVVDGRMVDRPVVLRAEAVLARARARSAPTRR